MRETVLGSIVWFMRARLASGAGMDAGGVQRALRLLPNLPKPDREWASQSHVERHGSHCDRIRTQFF